MTNHYTPWTNAPVRVIRRGHFWIPGERVPLGGKTYQSGPMFAEWEAPEEITRAWPVILMHGGGFQGTEWFDTPDGRPGWAQRLVEAGYVVLVIDRPGHSRSPFHPETLGKMGPPLADIPNIGPMRWGPTAAPLSFDPPMTDPDAVHRAMPGTLPIPALAGLPILIVTAEASAFAAASPPIAAFLNAAGASAELLHLPDHGIHGNGPLVTSSPILTRRCTALLFGGAAHQASIRPLTQLDRQATIAS